MQVSARKDKGARRHFSLRLSLSAALAGTVVITALLLGIAAFLSVRTVVRGEVRERLQTAAALGSLQINPELHAQIRTRADESGEAYRQLRDTMRRIRDYSRDVKFVYTFRKRDDGTINFVVDAEEDPNLVSHVGDRFPVNPEVTPSPVLVESFSTPKAGEAPKVYATHEFEDDAWGTWLSAFAPIRDKNGRIECVLGIDLAASRVLEYERRYFLLLLGLSLPLAIVMVLAGLLLARGIVRPILLIAEEMNRIQHLQISENPPVDSLISEVARMSVALENMKKGLRSFRRFVPADLVRELIEMEREAVVGADKRELTLFFSDIASFTTLCESWPPDLLAQRLDAYFERMTSSLLAHGATVDKFIGDAIMAFWGAPKPTENHAVVACRAALACQSALQELFAGWERDGASARLHTRIGLHTGEALVGNFGYEARLSYTAVGDNVNLAARLEGLNKEYGTLVLVSEDTWFRARDVFVFRLLDLVTVKGKTKPCRVFELIGEMGAVSPEEVTWAQRYGEAFEAYCQCQWERAGGIFRDYAAAHPQDEAAPLMVARCERFAAAPPPEGWCGATVMEHK